MELSADKAYASIVNFNAIDKVGATPYIPFKERHTGESGGLFQKAHRFFTYNRDEFLAHYHKRSNVESTVSMVKAKFGDYIRSKTEVAMRNEALCKLLCHNICCLISAAHELGVEALFGMAA
jgi:transposase